MRQSRRRYPARLRSASKAARHAAIIGLRAEVAALMDAHGAGHFQVGRFYAYARGRNPPALALLRAIKTALDPHGILSPGALGL